MRHLIRFFIFTFLVLGGLTQEARSTIDYSLFGLYRTKPVAGGVNFDIGWNQLVWGDQGSKPLYGFVRPSVGLFSAGQYNAYKYRMEFYPISILGFEYGVEKINNNGIYQDYDCETFQCQSKFENKFFKIKAVIGYGPFFAKYVLSKEEVTSDDVVKDFIYPAVGSALESTGDEVDSREIFIGTSLVGDLKMVIQDQKSIIKNRANTHRVRGLTFIKGIHTKYYLSLGNFKSHEVPDSNYIALAIAMEFGNSLKLD